MYLFYTKTISNRKLDAFTKKLTRQKKLQNDDCSNKNVPNLLFRHKYKN